MKNEPSNLAQFKYFIENLVGEVFADYESLWHWSINNTEFFWESLLNYFNIIIHHPSEKVLTGEELHEKSWFSGLTLNYAEHVFRQFREDQPALYYQSEREPLRDEVLELIEGNKPTVLERKKVGDRILSKILDFVDTFINGMTGK